MTGHSKWSKVKHIKGPLEGKCGAAFSKLVEEITVAARPGGDDLSGLPRPVVETARAQDIPKENSERAIKKGTGKLAGANHEQALQRRNTPTRPTTPSPFPRKSSAGWVPDSLCKIP